VRQHTVYTITILGIFSLFFISCATVPVTGRQQLRLIPMESMLTTSFQQYDQFLETNMLSKDEHNTRMVKTVGERIQRAVERYYRENNMSHKLKGYA